MKQPNSFAARFGWHALDFAGAKPVIMPEGQTVYRSQGFEKKLPTRDAYGTHDREIVYLEACPVGDGLSWAVESHTYHAGFKTTLSEESEVDARCKTGARQLGTCDSPLALAWVFYKHGRSLARQGYGPETRHDLEYIEEAPYSASLTILDTAAKARAAAVSRVPTREGAQVIRMAGFTRRL